MTELTIKEKIQKIARINEAAYGHVHIGFIRAFARLICDEMTGDLQNHDPGYTGNPDMLSGITVGHNEQVYWERSKAQEILKALE